MFLNSVKFRLHPFESVSVAECKSVAKNQGSGLLMTMLYKELDILWACWNFSVRPQTLHCSTLSEAIGSLSRRRNSSDGSMLIRRLTEV